MSTESVLQPSQSAHEVGKEDALSPAFNDSISQFLPTEVSCSESENEEEAEEGEFLEDVDEKCLCSAGESESNVHSAKCSHEGSTVPAAPENLHPAVAATPQTKFRGRPSSCVFVASLAASLTDDDLCISVTESFKKYGELTMVKVLRDPANRPYAFVQYTKDQDAKRAMKEAQGSTLNGRTIRCEPARVNRTLFICTKSRSSTNPVQAATVIQLAEKFGEVEQLVACRDQFSKRNYFSASTKGNAWFIQFAYRDDAIRAFATLKSDFNWIVEWAQNIEAPAHMNLMNKKSENLPTDANTILSDGSNQKDEALRDSAYQSHDDRRNSEVDINIDKKSIFVGQLDQSATEENLRARFSRHGHVSEINLIVKPNNVFAFIKFTTEEAAAAALEMENHAIFLNKTMHVQYREVGGNFKKHKRGAGNHSAYYQNNPYQPPRLNLAPPPINVGQRRSSTGSFSNHYSNYSMHDLQPFAPPQTPVPSSVVYGNGKRYKHLMKRKSSETGKLGNDDPDAGGQSFATDAASEMSESIDADDSSAASTVQNNSSAGGTSCKTKGHEYKKRGSFPSFDPYYFHPYYYPMEFPMGGMPPPPPGSATNQPYFMYYPIPPRNGMDYTEMPGMVFPPTGAMGPPLIPMSQQQFVPLKSKRDSDHEKTLLEY